MFCDEVIVEFTAGKGGDGCVSCRREKFIAKGGPDGGNGGWGGDVVLEGNANINTLYEFNVKKAFQADKGKNGSSKNKTGRGGEDKVMQVPLGTKIYDATTGDFVDDIVEHGQQFVVAYGGRGGYGNANFTSSTRQLPKFAELGEPGEVSTVKMELEMIADVALVGLPSAGKSTLISRISDAKPKIGDYPFTTLVPNLGVVSLSKFGGNLDQSFVVADVPGLIEGANEGKGLGHQFLKHIKRTAVIVHLIDLTSVDFLKNFEVINKELSTFDKSLGERKQFIAFNKTDAISEEDLEVSIEMFLEHYPDYSEKEIYPISAVSGSGLKKLLHDLYAWIEENKQSNLDFNSDDESLKPKEEYKVFRPHLQDPRVISVEKGEKKQVVDPFTQELYTARVFNVKGKRLEQIVIMTDMTNREARERVYDVLKKIKVNQMLRKEGVETGDVIRIGEKEFFYRGDK